MGLKGHSHCQLCKLDIDVDFEEQLEVTFTANPAVRATFDAGEYRCRCPSHDDTGGTLTVSGAPTTEVQTLRLVVDAEGSVTPKRATLAPGPCDVTVEFGYPEQWGFTVARVAARHNFVSAAHLTSQQDFRDLFSGEFLAPDVSFAIKSTTLMFTDIKGSTEMYEELGDAQAYRRVRDHFELMTEVIRRHEGGIVKTIGDAVMASFPINANAVRAAYDIQVAFHEVDEPLKGIEVKIGLHRGPAIAVTTNRNLDFFGRTVNVAARVQGKSLPRQILVSSPVLEDPAVTAFLAEHRLETAPVTAELKGIVGAHTLYAIKPRA
jgi:class 3 adenylate cyclase